MTTTLAHGASNVSEASVSGPDIAQSDHSSIGDSRNSAWLLPTAAWLLIAIAAAALGYAFRGGIEWLWLAWSERPEYSYGMMVLPLVGFFVWQRRDELESHPWRGAWSGTLLLLFGCVVLFLGELSTLFILIQYGLVIALTGALVAVAGWGRMRQLWIAPVLLLFTIPLPNFLYFGLSTYLQLISSAIGVEFIRLLDISVYLQGNVIDLGSYQLQVVEACSGLRYLFPLATIAFIAAYVYRGPLWQRAVIFLSSLPITVFMNSLRIGVIGVLVEHQGIGAAEGFLHFFEGWVVFMAAFALLLAEIWLLVRLSGERFHDRFLLEYPPPRPESREQSALPAPLIAAVVVTLITAALSALLPHRTESVPERASLDTFPLQFEDWRGRSDQLEREILETLALDDYLIADFRAGSGSSAPINLYIAYYANQRKGRSVHSPRTCLPGGGWEIESLERRELPITTPSGQPLAVNRTLIRLGNDRQLVYYWFQQRGRVITNEYLVKWYLFWDGLTRNRTDGALVRLTALQPPGASVEELEASMIDFASQLYTRLDDYIPR